MLKTEILRLEEKQQRELEIMAESTISNIKCDQCLLAQRRDERRKFLLSVESYEGFQRISEDDWENEIFPRATVETGDVWEAPGEQTIILPCTNKFTSNNKDVRIALNRFGGIAGLIKQNKSEGEVAMMIHSLGFPEGDGEISYNQREIYYPIISDGYTHKQAEDKNIFQSLVNTKELVLKHKKTKLAVPQLEGVEGTMFMRMLEYLFADTGVTVTIYKQTEAPKTAIKPVNAGKTSIIGNGSASIKHGKSRQHALLVKMNGKSYAELLKTVKNSINPRELGVDIKDIKKTRNGDLLLTVENGHNKAETLKKEMRRKLPEATTSLLVNTKVLHVKDIDQVTTVEEIREAVCGEIVIKPETFDVRALRPAYGNRQNATIIMPDEDAEKLLALGKIKIGWTNCKILERKKDVKCYKCWEYGHLKAQCSGQDRENLCLRCCKEGHKASDCQNPPYCVHCKKEGHQSGNPKCASRRGTLQKSLQ